SGTTTPTTAAATAATSAALCPNPPPAGVRAGELANIQPGGIGAPLATFPPRWGPADGVAAGTADFGKNSDGSNVIGVHLDPSTQRAVMLEYVPEPDKSLTLEQAQALALKLIPADSSGFYLGAPIAGNPLTFGYCSPTLASVFSGQNINNTYGRL